MKLSQTLFTNPETLIYKVTSNGNWDDYLNWQLFPISAPILASEYVGKGRLEGFFLLAAKFITSAEEMQDCFVDVSLPERISDYFYCKQNDQIVRARMYTVDGDVLPSVAIDYFGNYELFYSKRRPEEGIRILREGLAIAKRKSEIARDLGYILRDEKRYREAIEAFSIAISEQEQSFDYIERAQLYDFVGDKEKADEEWKFIEKKWGKDIVTDSRLSIGSFGLHQGWEEESGRIQDVSANGDIFCIPSNALPFKPIACLSACVCFPIR